MKTRSIALFVSMLCATGMLAAPAGAAGTTTEHAGGFAIAWPSDSALSTVQPGDAVRVSLSPSARARAAGRVATVSLSRVTRSGKLLVIAKRRLRSGRFSATLPREGLYRLRAVVGTRYVQSTFEVLTVEATVPCDATEGYEADLELDQSVAQPGDLVTITVTNTGTTCVPLNYGLTWQRLVDGRYTDVSFGVIWPATVLNLAPGEKQVQQVAVPRNTPPGEYRAVKTFTDGDGLTGELTVTP
jgi:hypothetical protein